MCECHSKDDFLFETTQVFIVIHEYLSSATKYKLSYSIPMLFQ
jgi:uncharacterized membrane protein YjdF